MQFKSILICAVAVLAGAAFATEKEIDELLANMRKAYTSAKSAKMQTETTILIEDEKIKGTFDVWYKAENKLYVRAEGAFGMEGVLKMICDGKKILVSTPEDKEERDFTIENLSDGAPFNLEVLCFWDSKRQLTNTTGGNMAKSELKIVKDQDWDGKKWTILEEKANEQKVFVKYWIDPKTSFIWKTEVMDLETRKPVMECIVKSLKIDVEIPETSFEIP